jgi:hypothetical protein
MAIDITTQRSQEIKIFDQSFFSKLWDFVKCECVMIKVFFKNWGILS